MEDVTRIAIPLVISGDFPPVRTVPIMFADKAIMGANERAIKKVPNILVESETSGTNDP